MVIRYLIEKEFLQMGRNAILPKIFVFLPVMMLLVIPFAANQEVKHLKFCAVDNDRSIFSQRLIREIDASEYFSLVAMPPDSRHAMESVENGSADVILEIGHDFESQLIKTGVADVYVAANSVNGMKGALAQSYMLQIIADFSSRLSQEQGLGVEPIAVRGMDVRPRFLFNERLDYKAFMVPAIIAMLLTLLIGFLPAMNIVGEKEKGTIEQINVTPVGRFSFIFSKLIPYWCVGLFLLSWSMLLAYLFYGMSPAGSIPLVYLYSTLFILIMSSLGLIVSNYSSTLQQAALLMFLFLVIFILMSGLLTPIASMPEWAQVVTRVNPLRYYIETMRTLYLKGSSLTDLMPQLTAMVVFASVSWTWAIKSYRKTG